MPEAQDRYSKKNPCPVCSGGNDFPSGQGIRCYGYVSSDGNFTFCTREEHAGSLPYNKGANGYCHLLEGGCNCGSEHRPAPLLPIQGSASRRPRVLEEEYNYTENGDLIYQSVRYRFTDAEGGKTFKTRRPDGAGGWTWNLKGVERLPYHLEDLIAAPADALVVIPEGEKDTDLLRGLGLVATTNSEGALNFQRELVPHFVGRHVVLFGDNDENGKVRLTQIAALLAGKTASIKAVQFLDKPEHYDVGDWLDEGHTLEELMLLIEKAPTYEPILDTEVDTKPLNEDEDPADKKGKRPSQATVLVDLAGDVELWHDSDQVAFATVEVKGHKENWRVTSSGFRRWLLRLYWEAYEAAPSAQAVQDALGVLEGKATFAGEQYDTSIRVAMHDGNLYLDLVNADWEVVEITDTGWTVIQNPPVKFRRTKGMAPLPRPVVNGDINALRGFINIGSDQQWVLILAWLISALWPEGPYPILIVNGEQGSAKSTLVKILKMLIDPNKAPLRSQPRDERDLMIAANNSWCLSFDNLSSIQPWLSDAFCRLSTGGGFSTRALYADAEETIFQSQRPVVFDGIEDLATRGDLLDRALILHLPTIPEKDRKPEIIFWKQFDMVKSSLLGALLDAMPYIIRELPNTTADKFPRMADFARLGMATERAFNLKEGTFTEAYSDVRGNSDQLVIESSPIGEPLMALAARGDWEGKVSDLLKDLDAMVGDSTKNRKGWPKTSARLSNLIRGIVPSMRQLHVHVEFLPRLKSGQNVTIRTSAQDSYTGYTDEAAIPLEAHNAALHGGVAEGVATDNSPTPNSNSATPGAISLPPDAQGALAPPDEIGVADVASVGELQPSSKVRPNTDCPRCVGVRGICSKHAAEAGN